MRILGADAGAIPCTDRRGRVHRTVGTARLDPAARSAERVDRAARGSAGPVVPLESLDGGAVVDDEGVELMVVRLVASPLSVQAVTSASSKAVRVNSADGGMQSGRYTRSDGPTERP